MSFDTVFLDLRFPCYYSLIEYCIPSWTVCTSVSCVLAAPPPVPPTGGTGTGILAPLSLCRYPHNKYFVTGGFWPRYAPVFLVFLAPQYAKRGAAPPLPPPHRREQKGCPCPGSNPSSQRTMSSLGSDEKYIRHIRDWNLSRRLGRQVFSLPLSHAPIKTIGYTIMAYRDVPGTWHENPSWIKKSANHYNCSTKNDRLPESSRVR